MGMCYWASRTSIYIEIEWTDLKYKTRYRLYPNRSRVQHVYSNSKHGAWARVTSSMYSDIWRRRSLLILFYPGEVQGAASVGTSARVLGTGAGVSCRPGVGVPSVTEIVDREAPPCWSEYVQSRQRLRVLKCYLSPPRVTVRPSLLVALLSLDFFVQSLAWYFVCGCEVL
jgi:hypothetical protein